MPCPALPDKLWHEITSPACRAMTCHALPTLPLLAMPCQECNAMVCLHAMPCHALSAIRRHAIPCPACNAMPGHVVTRLPCHAMPGLPCHALLYKPCLADRDIPACYVMPYLPCHALP